MAWRHPPKLPVPPQFRSGIAAAMAAGALQHQDELTMLLAWSQTLTPPVDFRVIIEIGTHSGGTLACWAELAPDLVIAVDMPSAWAGVPLHTALERDARFTARYPQVRSVLGNSHDPAIAATVSSHLAGRLADLLFIDGDHSRWGVEDDFHRYRPFVRPGGIIAFHDCNDSERNRTQGLGVADFFATLPEPKRLFTLDLEWGGVGAVVA